MHDGQTLKFIRGVGDPLMSPLLGLVAFLNACGIRFADPDKPILDSISGDGENPKREFVWTFDGEHKANFNGEIVNFDELCRRFESEAWCDANNEHPIAYARQMWRNLIDLRDNLFLMSPHLKIERVIDDGENVGRAVAFIARNETPERRAEILAGFEE